MAARFNARPHDFHIPKRKKVYRAMRDDSPRTVFCAGNHDKANELRPAQRVKEEVQS